MTNSELKRIIKGEGFALWKIAEAAGVAEITIQRWLRSERDTSHQPEIIKAFEELKALKGGGQYA